MKSKEPTAIENAYKLAEKFAAAQATQHNLSPKEAAELRTGIKSILITLHTGIVEEMKASALTDITRALAKQGYKIPKPSDLTNH